MSENPKSFERVGELQPLSTEGLSSLEEFKNAEAELKERELLKKIGLTDEEIVLYLDNENGTTSKHSKIEISVLQEKLKNIYVKLEEFYNHNETSDSDSSCDLNPNPEVPNFNKFYPDKHPINTIKALQEDLFDTEDYEDITPITKRRKILRRIQRKLDKLEESSSTIEFVTKHDNTCTKERNPNTLWDVKELPKKRLCEDKKADRIIGPKKQKLYTIKDNKIVRVKMDGESSNQYRAEEILQAENAAEERLLEGTKLSIDDLKKIPRFRNYNPGEPNKVLFIKNISEKASQDDVSLLFNQFIHDNGGPIDVRLLQGKLRGQAFVRFNEEDLAVQALDSLNGTVVKGKPIVVLFSSNTHNMQNVEE